MSQMKPTALAVAASLSVLCGGAKAAGVGTTSIPRVDPLGVEKVNYRRCWTRNGVTRCRWVEEDRYVRGYRARPRYQEYDANRLPYGTRRWWDQMEREERAR